jgi:hypothetical protein
MVYGVRDLRGRYDLTLKQDAPSKPDALLRCRELTITQYRFKKQRDETNCRILLQSFSAVELQSQLAASTFSILSHVLSRAFTKIEPFLAGAGGATVIVSVDVGLVFFLGLQRAS